MPDATVWVAGGNPFRGNYEPHMEIYSPAYLFNPDGSLATRPSITNLSASKIGYGSGFQVQTPDAASISTVVLMRNGASTHAFDMEQRYVVSPSLPGLVSSTSPATQQQHRAAGLLHVVHPEQLGSSFRGQHGSDFHCADR